MPQLARVLMDRVARGASVGFMGPLGRERAEAFWTGVAEGVARGERRLIVATLDGTVLVLNTASDAAERLHAGLPDGALCDTAVFYKQLSAPS